MGFDSPSGINSSSDVDHNETANRTHSGDSITPSSSTADELQANNETFVRATRGTESSSTSSSTRINAFDGESKDTRNEFNASAQFSPDKDGEYKVWALVNYTTVTAGEELSARVRNVSDGTDVQDDQQNQASGGSNRAYEFSWEVSLNSSKTYEIQATNFSSSFKIGTRSVGTIKRGVVQ